MYAGESGPENPVHEAIAVDERASEQLLSIDWRQPTLRHVALVVQTEDDNSIEVQSIVAELYGSSVNPVQQDPDTLHAQFVG